MISFKIIKEHQGCVLALSSRELKHILGIKVRDYFLKKEVVFFNVGHFLGNLKLKLQK